MPCYCCSSSGFVAFLFFIFYLFFKLPNVLYFEVTIMIIVLIFALYCVIVNCGITHVVVIFYIVITMNEVR